MKVPYAILILVAACLYEAPRSRAVSGDPATDCRDQPAVRVDPDHLPTRGIWSENTKDEVPRKIAADLHFEVLEYAIWQDLDCNGEDDLLLIGLRPAIGFDRPAAALAGVFFDTQRRPRSEAIILWSSIYEEVRYLPVLFMDLDGDGIRDVVAQHWEGDLEVTSVVYIARDFTFSRLDRGILNNVPVASTSSLCMDSTTAVATGSPGARSVRLPTHPRGDETIGNCGFARESFSFFSGGLELELHRDR
jgi:hypothetical protein